MRKKVMLFLYIILVLLLLGLFALYLYDKHQVKEYSTTLEYFDSTIMIKFYTNDSDQAKQALKEIDSIYLKYGQLTDRYREYDDIINLYSIRHNFSNEEYLSLDQELYDFIKYAIELYDETNGFLDISIGNVTDLWKTYRETTLGVPTSDELEIVHNQSIDDIHLESDNRMLNNHVNIDLDQIVKGYVNEKVATYLKSIGIDSYLIHANGAILLGDSYQQKNYKVALQDPNSESDLFIILKVKNKAIITKSNSEKYYEYNGVRYHNIIDIKTLYPANYMKSVTVIAEDSNEANKIATMLFLMDVEEGKKYIETLDNVEAIWYQNDNKIVKSDGIKNYE